MSEPNWETLVQYRTALAREAEIDRLRAELRWAKNHLDDAHRLIDRLESAIRGASAQAERLIERAEKAEAAIARVRELLDDPNPRNVTRDVLFTMRLRAALDGES